MTEVAVERETEVVLRRCESVAKASGIDVRYVFGGAGPDGSFSVTIEHNTTDLNFEILAKLSQATGSRDIQLGCDLGAGSDRTHEPCIVVRWPSLETAVVHVQAS